MIEKKILASVPSDWIGQDQSKLMTRRNVSDRSRTLREVPRSEEGKSISDWLVHQHHRHHRHQDLINLYPVRIKTAIIPARSPARDLPVQQPLCPFPVPEGIDNHALVRKNSKQEPRVQSTANPRKQQRTSCTVLRHHVHTYHCIHNHAFITFVTAICIYKTCWMLLARHQAEIDSPDKAKQASHEHPLIGRDDSEAQDRRQRPHFEPCDHNRPEVLEGRLSA